MAVINPPIKVIKNLKPYPTAGERTLVNYLINKLDDSYEIFFQPFLNGDRPDIIILRKNSGALIIEVKDWNIDNFYIDPDGHWRLIENNSLILSPLEQVLKYKNNLYGLHIDELNKIFRKDKKIFGIVSCAVYFHNVSTTHLSDFLNPKELDSNDSYHKKLKYIQVYGKDLIKDNLINQMISRSKLDRTFVNFNENLYSSFKRFLQSPFHNLEDGKIIKYTSEQIELSRSETKPRRKIKGYAGCGKTIVLAKRAVNSHIRTGNKVLILTFNISLRNYIHDKINEVRENFFWNYFEIVNYHQFFLGCATNYNLKISSLEDFDNPDFFKLVSNKIKKYEAILIDEVQDYKTEWLKLIHNYFLVKDGEFAVFGDEKQNIYNRGLDENKEPITVGIRGQFNTSLNKSFRFTPEISNLAEKFQKQYFTPKYNLDIIDVYKQEGFKYDSNIEYNFDNNKNDLLNDIYNILTKYSIHPSDVAILATRVDIIRDLEYLVRNEKHENTTCMFESKEEYDELLKTYTSKDENGIEIFDKIGFKEALEDIRRVNKLHFWMKTGTMKFSTIHSFKGWEIHTLFLIIDEENDNDSNWLVDELIYTAITRCRFNLFIINLSNLKYDDFFKKNIQV